MYMPSSAPNLPELHKQELGSMIRRFVCLTQFMLVHKLRGEFGTKRHQINTTVEVPTLLVTPVTVAKQLIAYAQTLGVPHKQMHLCSNPANPSRTPHGTALCCALSA